MIQSLFKIEPLGENVLTSFEDHFNDPNVPSEDLWYLEEHEGCDATFELPFIKQIRLFHKP